MFELRKEDLPSRGIFYPATAEIVTIRPFGIEELMEVSSAIETKTDAPLIKAVAKCTNIVDQITYGDFYFILACIRVLTFTKLPIQWNYVCRSTRLTITFNDNADEIGIDLFAKRFNFKQVTSNVYTRANLSTDEATAVIDHLRVDMPNSYSGSFGYCNTANQSTVDVDLLMSNVVRLSDSVNEDSVPNGLRVPTVDTLAEYKALYADVKLRKLLPLVACIGSGTLAQTIANMRQTSESVGLLEVAAEFNAKIQHGIANKLMCRACTECGARTDEQQFVISAESFFQK